MATTEAVETSPNADSAPHGPPSAEPSGNAPSNSRKKLGMILSVVIVGVVGGLWLLNRPPEQTPVQRMQHALKLLDKPGERVLRQAKRIALDLEAEEYRDPEFMGANQYILGIVAFRTALNEDESVRDRFFEQARTHLEDAERISVAEAYRPAWSYALGTSLHRLGLATRARTLLEEAFAKYPLKRLDAASQLVEISLDLQTPNELRRALELSDIIINELPDDENGSKALGPAQLRKAQILLALGRTSEANALLPTNAEGTRQSLDLTIVRAQTMMARQESAGYRQARQILEPVAAASVQHQRLARQASYLIGLCHEALGETELAIDVYERTARKYEDTHEGLAAELREADLLRKAGRHEEALAAYRSTLAQVRKAKEFRNRWLPVRVFRERIFQAWNEWIDAERFSEALSLARLAPPLLTNVEAAELTARASQRRAEAFAKELSQKNIAEKQLARPQLEEYWRASGEAFVKLAERLKTTSKYTGTLWIAAEHFRFGKGYDQARVVLNEFLNNEPRELFALGLVRDGQAALGLDQLDDALKRFQQVIRDYPTDPSSFEAAYWLGLCHVERNEPDQATATWKSVINSPSLSPAASEWRLSLFALARHEFHTATGSWKAAGKNLDSDQFSVQTLQDAASRFEEYLKRYPDSPEVDHATYLLAKACQRLSQVPREKLESVEIENERRLLQQEMTRYLLRAQQYYLALQQKLNQIRNQPGLTKLQQRMLRDSYFDLADTEFDLGRYPEAITRYATATNLYPENARVLAAYLQMAECNDHLGKRAEALSMLQQARVVLKRMPDEAFQSPSTNYRSRADWEQWLGWATKLHQARDLQTQ